MRDPNLYHHDRLIALAPASVPCFLVSTWAMSPEEIAQGGERWELLPVLSLAIVETWESRSSRAVLPDGAETERRPWVVVCDNDCGVSHVDPLEPEYLGVYTSDQLKTPEVLAYLLAGADEYCRRHGRPVTA